MAQEKRTLVDEVLDDVLQVRETALANAKLALEEAFEPRIKSMISRHLQNETELDEVELEERGDEDMDEMEDEELEERGDKDEMEERSSDDEMEERGMMNAGDDDMEEELEPSDIDDENEEPSDVASDSSDIGEGDHSDEEMEEMNHDDEMEEMGHDDEMEEEDDLDLESVIAELEAELSEEEDEDHMDEEEDEVDIDDMSMDSDEEEEDDDEIIDLDELLSALTEEDDEEEVEEVVEENSELEQENERLASELKEHREAVEILRTKLNEVNLLNAKLLYTTKLFRKFNLSNDQKMKVVESFDRTSSVRETKLVFSTLAESLGMNKPSKNKKNVSSITEGFASKPTTSTKPKQQEIISEGNAVADRFRRLVSYNK